MKMSLFDIQQSLTFPYWAPASVRNTLSTDWPSEALKTICHDHNFYLQFDISCDKVQMRPYHFLLARPSFVLRWQPAYAGRGISKYINLPNRQEFCQWLQTRTRRFCHWQQFWIPMWQ